MSDIATQRVTRRFRIRGRVQGVGFRWWTRTQAQRLQLTGWVRNCADGSVEVQAQGAGGDVARLEALLRQGPPGAHISAIEGVTAEQMAATDFAIRR